MSSSKCCFLTCIQILRRQVRWSSIPISWRIFHRFFVIHTVKGFGVVNKAEVDVFLELAFSMIQRMLAIWSLVFSAFSKSSLNIWKFTVHALLKAGLDNFEHYFVSVWDECNFAVVWTFFGTPFLRDWNESWTFSVLRPLVSLPDLLAYRVQHFHRIIFKDLK